MSIQPTRLSNLATGTKFRTSPTSTFFYAGSFNRASRKMSVTADNGAVFEMRPKRRVFIHDEASR